MIANFVERWSSFLKDWTEHASSNSIKKCKYILWNVQRYDIFHQSLNEAWKFTELNIHEYTINNQQRGFTRKLHGEA